MSRYAEPMLRSEHSHADTSSDNAAPIPFTRSNAHAVRALDLPRGVRLRQYSNAPERVFYEEDQIHTFSMYLQGGYQTHRTDVAAALGAPGHFCLMPAGSYSAWEIGEEQKFIHIYFDDSYIKQLALQNFDTDPRLVSLPHLTFQQSAPLMALLQHSMLNWDWSEAGNQMLLQQGLQTLLLNMLQTVGIKRINTDQALKSGLSPAAQHRVRDFVEGNYQRPILLIELADLAGLSEYHFARMFKISFAETPQHYISKVRIEQLKRSLVSNHHSSHISMAQLALDHGFSSQSHMGRVFKQFVGVTPGQYAKLH